MIVVNSGLIETKAQGELHIQMTVGVQLTHWWVDESHKASMEALIPHEVMLERCRHVSTGPENLEFFANTIELVHPSIKHHSIGNK